MDAAKKTAIEKRLVIGLAGVFVVTLVMGPLRGLGLFRRSAPAPQTSLTEPVSVSEPLGVMLHQRWQDVDREAQAMAHPPEAPTARAPLYTAHRVRDPFTSLLPKPHKQEIAPVKPLEAEPASSGQAQASQPGALRVQGIVWGGGAPRAIIDGEVYGVDDVVKGARIVAIDRSGVAIETGGAPRYYAPAPTGGAGMKGSRSGQGDRRR